MHPDEKHAGFTLVEAVMVIAITGIVAAMVAVFIRQPLQGYFDSARRAELTDIADTAVRHISRDLHLALPNSVRLVDNNTLEFLHTRTGGRYRATVQGDGTGDILDFTQTNEPTASFDILGSPITFSAGDQIVVYNLGITGADAYEGTSTSRRTYNGPVGAASNVQFAPATAFPFESPSNSFQVVDTPVTYICDLTAGTLTRIWGYAIQAAQPAAAPAGANTAELASHVTNCVFTYAPGVDERSGLVSIQLSITEDGETVNLYHEVHVSNAP